MKASASMHLVFAHPSAVVSMHLSHVWIGRTPVGWDEVMGRVVDPAIWVVSVLAAGTDGV